MDATPNAVAGRSTEGKGRKPTEAQLINKIRTKAKAKTWEDHKRRKDQEEKSRKERPTRGTVTEVVGATFSFSRYSMYPKRERTITL
jgi:hypothetical protein